MNLTLKRSSPATYGTRPACMATLGLLPPYTAEDVKQAYYGKARTTHPDMGGNPDRFKRVQSAFEKATDYVLTHQTSWQWLAGSIETYEKQERLIEQLRKYGAIVRTEPAPGLAQTWGEDLAQVCERIVSIQLKGKSIDDRVIDLLIRYKSVLGKLRHLSLANSKVTDCGVERLKALPSIEFLDLRNTATTAKGLKVIESLPALSGLDIRGDAIGLLTLARLAWCYCGMKLLADWPGMRRAK